MTTTPDDNPFQPPSYSYPVLPPGQRKTSWFTPRVRIVMAVCVLLAAGLGVGGAFGLYGLTNTGVPGTGSCLYLTQESGGQTYHRAGCGERQATYKVDDWTPGTGSCELGDYVRFQIFGNADHGTRTLCLALNVDTGDCVRDVSDRAKIAKVDCGDPKAEIKADVISRTIDPSECDHAVKALVYSGPPARTICLVANGEHI